MTVLLQVTANVLSVSGSVSEDVDVLAVNAASAALALSNIPFPRPVAAVRVALPPNQNDPKPIISPTRQERAVSPLNLVLAGCESADGSGELALVMVEAEASEVPKGQFRDAVTKGLAKIGQIIAAMRELSDNVGKLDREWTPTLPAEPSPRLVETLRTKAEAELDAIFDDVSHDKISRDQVSSH